MCKKDTLLGAVIDGEEGEAEYQEEIGACVSINRHMQLTGNMISRGLNWFHYGLDIQRLFALVCWRSTCLFRTFHTSGANRISLDRDTFTDDDHKLLDEKIMNAFDIFWRYNEEPDLSDLLSRVTMNKRLKILTHDDAEELLDREPSIAGLLRNGWQAGSFKEVRQLGVFPICSTSNF